jgi:hypothetical protein
MRCSLILFSGKGRRSVPPSVVAVVMVLQRLEGLSDREAVDRFTFDARWRYAAGAGGWDGQRRTSFAHTVLVDMRERLRRSDRPDRVFEVALQAARVAGLVGRRRALDSTPLYDAVSTMDTVTLIRSAIRGLLAAADPVLAAQLRATIRSGDGYTSNAKPVIDWDDPAVREHLVESRADDAYAMLACLYRRRLAEPVAQAAQLLATVTGQDLEQGDDGVLRIARKVAPDRVHSDRGCQYTSAQYRRLADHHGVRLSVGRRGQCWDNAVAESFFATIKAELLDRRPWPTRTAAHKAIFNWIEGCTTPAADTPHWTT